MKRIPPPATEARKKIAKPMEPEATPKDMEIRDDAWPDGLRFRNKSYRFRRLVHGQEIRVRIGQVPLSKAIAIAGLLNTKIQLGIGCTVRVIRFRNQRFFW